MAKATIAYNIMRPMASNMLADAIKPDILFGKGVPDGTIAPFRSSPLGSLYIQTDAGSAQSCLYVKQTNNGQDSDCLLYTSPSPRDS